MANSLRTRLARLEARIPVVEPEASTDPTADAEWMAIAHALGSDHFRKLVEEHPEHRGDFASTIAALEEWEATEPGWWLEGPFARRTWRYGVRTWSEANGDGE